MESWTHKNIIDFVRYVKSGVPEQELKCLGGLTGRRFLDVNKETLTSIFGDRDASRIQFVRDTFRNDTFQLFTDKIRLEEKERQEQIRLEEKEREQKFQADAYYAYTLSQPCRPASSASLEKSPFTKQLDEQGVSASSLADHITDPKILPLINKWIADAKLDVELFIQQAVETTFRDFVQRCFRVRLATEVRKCDLTVPQNRIIIELKCADRVADDHIAQLLVYMGRKIGKRVQQKEMRRGAVMYQSGSEMRDVAKLGNVVFWVQLLEITFMPDQPPHVTIKTDRRFALATASRVDEAEVKEMDFLFSTFFGIDHISIINPSEIPLLDAEPEIDEGSGNVSVQETPANRPEY